MHTCLIGQHVEVQKIDGHVYSGIFHDAVTDEYGKTCYSDLSFFPIAPWFTSAIMFAGYETMSRFLIC